MFWNSKLKRQIENLKTEVEGLRKERNSLLEEPTKLRKICAGLIEEIAEIKPKLRQQNEADLYLESAQIMRRLEKGEKNDILKKEIERQQELCRQLNSQKQQQQTFSLPLCPPSLPLEGILGGQWPAYPF